MQWIGGAHAAALVGIAAVADVAHARPTAEPPAAAPAGPAPASAAPAAPATSPEAGPAPAVPPPRARRLPWFVWSAGLGLGAVAIDAGDGPCPACDHFPIALATGGGVGIQIVPGIAIGAQVQVQLQLVSDHPGGTVQYVQITALALAQARVAPRLQVLGGLGYTTANYSWEDHGWFGSTDQSAAVGSGPAVVGGTRFEIFEHANTDFGVEARLTVASLGDAGTVPTVTVDGVFGWF